jgi:hypothetical protein
MRLWSAAPTLPAGMDTNIECGVLIRGGRQLQLTGNDVCGLLRRRFLERVADGRLSPVFINRILTYGS